VISRRQGDAGWWSPTVAQLAAASMANQQSQMTQSLAARGHASGPGAVGSGTRNTDSAGVSGRIRNNAQDKPPRLNLTRPVSELYLGQGSRHFQRNRRVTRRNRAVAGGSCEADRTKRQSAVRGRRAPKNPRRHRGPGSLSSSTGRQRTAIPRIGGRREEARGRSPALMGVGFIPKSGR